MTNDYRVRIAEIDEYAVELRALIPDSFAAFGALSKAAQKAGALDKKTKELLALAIGVAIRCDGCIGYHAREARNVATYGSARWAECHEIVAAGLLAKKAIATAARCLNVSLAFSASISSLASSAFMAPTPDCRGALCATDVTDVFQ